MGLGRGEDLSEGAQVQMPGGTKKVKFQETYEGLPIVGATVVMEKDSNGKMTDDVSGHLVEGIDDDLSSTDPRLDVNEVFHMVARKNRDDPNTAMFDPETDATLEVILEGGQSEQVRARLVYKISYTVENSAKISRPFSIVDANTGDILKSWEGLSVHRASKIARRAPRVQANLRVNGVGGNLKMGKAQYGKDFPKLAVTQSCTLENNVAKVYHCQSRWYCYARTPASFDCETGPQDEVNGAYSPLNDALFYISATYEMFNKWYAIPNPLQRHAGDVSPCRARIHFGRAFENAFWDGRYITFGDGNSTFYPLTSINVVAHEISHGVTEMNSGLLYFGESGGMNEAFSDMAGEAVEYFASKDADWMVGFEIFKDPKKALRYFDHPSEDGMSIGSYRQYCPGMDPHYSSGLFNRAFYTLGQTHGWDLRATFHPFVIANQLYWREDSRFYEAACDVVQAARDLRLNTDDVIDAFRAVGIEPCVDTAKGAVATSELSVPAGHEILLEVEVSESMPEVDHITVEVNGGRMDVSVKTPKCRYCSERTSYWGSSTVDICDIVPGMYEISLIPENDLTKGSVLILGPSSFIVENATLGRGDNDSMTIQFKMPPFVVENELQVIMRLDSQYGYVVGALRHGEPADLKSFEFDYVFTTYREVMICDVKEGDWFLTMKTFDRRAFGVDVEVVTLLGARRKDTVPRPTSSTGFL